MRFVQDAHDLVITDLLEILVMRTECEKRLGHVETNQPVHLAFECLDRLPWRNGNGEDERLRSTASHGLQGGTNCAPVAIPSSTTITVRSLTGALFRSFK